MAFPSDSIVPVTPCSKSQFVLQQTDPKHIAKQMTIHDLLRKAADAGKDLQNSAGPWTQIRMCRRKSQSCAASFARHSLKGLQTGSSVLRSPSFSQDPSIYASSIQNPHKVNGNSSYRHQLPQLVCPGHSTMIVMVRALSSLSPLFRRNAPQRTCRETRLREEIRKPFSSCPPT